MIIKVKRNSDGKIFTNDMSAENNQILEIHFCTSYTQVKVQQEIDGKYPVFDIICQPLGSTPNPIDLIATQNDETGVLFTD